MAKIENLRIDSLTPYERNPRNNDQAVAGVVASIRQYGFIGAIIVNKDRVIINGHTRVKAMKELGAETIPAIVVDHLTPEQERALRIADNFGWVQLRYCFGALCPIRGCPFLCQRPRAREVRTRINGCSGLKTVPEPTRCRHC